MGAIFQGVAAFSAFAGRVFTRAVSGVMPLRWSGDLSTIAQLEAFVGARSAFVAQNQLFGCLKTQESGRFRDFFEDERSSILMRDAATELCEACLSDLSLYAAAVVMTQAKAAPADAQDLARHCFVAGLDRAESQEAAERRQAALERFETRLDEADWRLFAQEEPAFRESPATLLRHAEALATIAPLDPDLVLKSMREKWREICGQLCRKLDASAVVQDLRDAQGA